VRRAFVALGALAWLAGTAAAAPAHADPPEHLENSFTESQTMPAGEFCDVSTSGWTSFMPTDRPSSAIPPTPTG
jgi:hypothetical protein